MSLLSKRNSLMNAVLCGVLYYAYKLICFSLDFSSHLNYTEMVLLVFYIFLKTKILKLLHFFRLVCVGVVLSYADEYFFAFL